MPLDVLPESTATSGLTDAELRASAVPVSASSLPLPTGAATETTVATLLQEGTSITGASMPSGGAHGMGWLSAIWKAITDRLPAALVSGRLDVNVGNTATVTGSGGTFPVTDSGGSLTVDAPVGTPVFVRLSDGSSAISTLPVTGDVATGAGLAAGGWFSVAGRGSTATPTAGSTDDLYVPFWLDRSGRLNTIVKGLPDAAALSDTASNPTTILVGACEQQWDPVNSQWHRKQAHNSRNLIASASYNPGAGSPTASAVQANYTGLFCFAQCYVSVAGTGTLTFRVLGRAGGSFYEVLAQLTISGTGLKTINFGPGCMGQGTGATVSANVGFVGGVLPQDWYVDVVHSAASAWTYKVDADTI